MESRRPDNRLALTARAGSALAASLREYLLAHAHITPLECTYKTIGDFLYRDADGMILATAENDEDSRDLVRLVQDVSLQQLQPLIVAVHGDDARSKTPHPWIADLAEVVFWPSDRERLLQLVKCIEDCEFPFVHPSELPLVDVLRHSLAEQTPSLTHLIDHLVLAAQHDVTVLLTGETGTGKTYCARLLHDYSPRRDQPFLHISCGALAPSLVESEFFGHVRGAFTGADRHKVGKFEAAGRGTLLLDEVDTLTPKSQAALLRVIETGEFEPVGGVESKQCEARLLVASNIPLEQAVEDGEFRSDLYFRLNVMSFHFPPLCERIEDIAPLARSMAARFNRKFAKSLYEISPQALSALERFTWPGNLRQLENAMQHAVLVSTGPELQLQHLPAVILDQAITQYPKAARHDESLETQRDKGEREAILRALVANGYNRSRTAEALRISRVTLYKKMDKHGLTEIPISRATGAIG